MITEYFVPAILSLTMPFYPIKSSYDRRVLYPMDNTALVERYVEALRKEAQGAAPDYTEFELQAVHIGGGIAGHAADEPLGQLLRDMRGWFHFADDAQILLNVHPGMVSAETLMACKRGRVNWLRVDYGTADPFESEAMRRFLPPSAMDTSMVVLAKSGLNLAFEILIGLPGQSRASLQNTLDRVVAYGAKEFLLYKLEPVAGTLFAEKDSVRYRNSASPRKRLPDEKEREALYQTAIAYLEEKGYTFAAPDCYALAGQSSQYEGLYALGCARIGFGLGAKTRMDGIMARNTQNMGTYLRYSTEPEKITASVHADRG